MNGGLNLRDEDRRAVDLLMDRTRRASGNDAAARVDGNGGNGNGHHGHVFVSGDGVSPDRLNRVDRLLRMLELLPQPEPPQDLVSRTLKRVDEPSAALEPRHPLAADVQQAHA